jgi:DnaK suppressor protein
MDVFDRAQEAEELFRQVALRGHFSRQGKPLESGVQQYPGETRPFNSGAGISSGPRICPDCGEEIGAGRLEANPAAVRCVGCQTKKELGHGHFGEQPD